MTESSIADPIPVKRSFRQKVLSIGAALLVLSLIVVSVLLYREWAKRFPNLAPGSYVGVITLKDEGGEGGESENKSEKVSHPPKKVKFYVERKEGSEEFLFVILKSGREPQVISGVPSDTRGGSSDLLPLSLSSGSERVNFTGERVSEGVFRGIVRGDDLDGTWELKKIDKGAASPEVATFNETELFLRLKAELQEVNDKIAIAESHVPEQRAEIDKLTAFVTEGAQLRAKADERYAGIKEQLDRAEKVLAAKQEEAKKLESTLELSQKLSGMGHLVALAREARDRERRWVQSMLTSSGSVDELDGAVERGEKVLEVRRQILSERAKIESLLKKDNPEPNNEDSEAHE